MATKKEKSASTTEGKALGCKFLKINKEDGYECFQSIVESVGENWELMELVMQGVIKPKKAKDEETGKFEWITTDHINKILVSAGEEKVLLYMDSLEKEMINWLMYMTFPFGGKIIEHLSKDNRQILKAIIVGTDELSPIKIKDLVISSGIEYLRVKKLLPEKENEEDDIPPELPDDW